MISHFVGSCFRPWALELWSGWDVNRNPKGCNFWNRSKIAWLILCFMLVLFLIMVTWDKNIWDVCTVHETANTLLFCLSEPDIPNIFSLTAVFLLSFLCELVLLWKKLVLVQEKTLHLARSCNKKGMCGQIDTQQSSEGGHLTDWGEF